MPVAHTFMPLPSCLGLNLLRLLAQGRISDFHIELEAIGSQHLKNIYISHPIAIEQALMEGSYNKVYIYRIQSLLRFQLFNSY